MLAAITAPEEVRWDRGVWVVEEGVEGRARGWRLRRLGEVGAAVLLLQLNSAEATHPKGG